MNMNVSDRWVIPGVPVQKHVFPLRLRVLSVLIFFDGVSHLHTCVYPFFPESPYPKLIRKAISTALHIFDTSGLLVTKMSIPALHVSGSPESPVYTNDTAASLFAHPFIPSELKAPEAEYK